ncbi:MAG TPA: hypothetical protein VEK57_19365 [Thermoanaerobaculia bacterium]|nr:hypothetical protein [Thermoanaerobaculia bacterium]
MTKNVRFAALCALVVLVGASTYAQERPMVGTVIDIDEGRNRLQIELDDAAQTRVSVETDAISTTYHGFGTMIAGKPEIFTGSRGLSNIRVDDRVEIRGFQRSEGVYRGTQVTLLGRSVPAAPTGVGSTRDPATSGTTPMDDRTSGTYGTGGRVEGTIRQINEREGRLVIQTSDRRMITVRTGRNTPVYYRGEVYRVTSLELGDRIRVEAEPRDAQTDEITARRIDVTASVQETGTAAGSGATVTVLEGRVLRTEPGLDYVYVDSGRGEVRVDMRSAEDARGEIIRARDVRAGDRLEISGSYNRTGDMFQASTVRFTSGGTDDPIAEPEPEPLRYGLVTITGTVTETLEDGATIGFRDRDSNRVLRIWVSETFVVRTKGTTYTTAESLKVNDTAVIQAFRDTSGNLIAQTVRLRNR